MTSPRLTGTQWLICVIAVIGFTFDIYELLMLPLIVGPALQELIGAAPGSPEFQSWVGRLFYIPAVAGGIFGLLGGYLTDRLGRRRVLTWSILLYAFGAFAPGSATSPMMLLVLRCIVFIGVCVEFVAAVAWLAELFPHPKQRERVLGYTQAFSSVGGLLVAMANGLAVAWANDLPAIHMPEFLSGLGERQGSACRMALHDDVGADSGHPVDHHPPVPARVSRVAAEARCGHAQASQLRGAVFARVAAHDNRHHTHVCHELRRGVRRDPTHPADRAGSP